MIYAIEDYATPAIAAGAFTSSDQIRAAVADLDSRNPDRRMAAFMFLKDKYPREITQWWQARARQRSVLRSIPVGLGDPLTIAAVIQYIPAVVNAVANIFSGKVVDPDPKHPGRSLKDARTYLEQVTKIYPSKFSSQGDINVANNYGAVLKIKEFPPTDQHIADQSPYHVLLSWDGNGTWLDARDLKAIPVGNRWQVSLVDATGRASLLPGYYNQTQYEDGSARFDFAGMNAPSTVTQPTVRNGSTNASEGTIFASGKAGAPGTGAIITAPLPGSGGSVDPGSGSVPAGSDAGTEFDIVKIIEKIKKGETLPQTVLNFVAGIPWLLDLYKQYAGKGAKDQTPATPTTPAISPAAIAVPAGLLLAFSMMK